MAPEADGQETAEQLRKAFHANRLLDLRRSRSGQISAHRGRRWGVRRQVPAGLIALLLSDVAEHTDGLVALRLAGARITGALDLRHTQIRHALILEDCYFDEPVDLTGAHAPWLSLQRCWIPGVIGYCLRVEGDTNLSGLSSRHVDLRNAHVA